MPGFGRAAGQSHRGVASLVTLVALVARGSTATAAPGADTGIAADRFVPAIGPNAMISVEGGDAPAAGAVAMAASIGYLSQPITLVNRITGDLVSRPVRAAVDADLAVEIGLTHWLAIGLGVPLTLGSRGDRLAGLDSGDERPLASPTLGDVRLRAKFHLGDERGAWSYRFALLGILTAPAGGESDFAATSGPTLEPRLAASVAWHWLAVSADLGYRFAPARTLAGTNFGNELAGGIAASAGVWRVRAILEYVASSAGPSELRGALRALLPRNVAIDAGIGGGLNHDAATPAWRAFVVVRYGG